jgi:hypothetical protein
MEYREIVIRSVAFKINDIQRSNIFELPTPLGPMAGLGLLLLDPHHPIHQSLAGTVLQ